MEKTTRDFMVTELKWTTITSDEVEASKFRLEASVFNVEAKKAKESLANCKHPLKKLVGYDGIANAYHRLRFKRVFVEKSDMPIFQPSQITELYPKPLQFISAKTKTDIEALKVSKGQILMTCSGTIGKCTLTSDTLKDKIFSHDLLRITAINPIDTGLIYAFFRSQTGQLVLTTNNYGAVIQHIEPEHLEDILIPYPNDEIRASINNDIWESFELRDRANELLIEAENLLIDELGLPKIEDIRPDYFEDNIDVKNFSVNFDALTDRFDASFHIPITNSIVDYLLDNAKEVLPLSDSRLTKHIILPGRFKRHYVERDFGTVFLGGKQIHELDPSNKKYLSVTLHGDRISQQLFLHENMIAITCSGTIGKVNIIPKHWENWTMSQHVLRVVPENIDLAGYLYTWLNSDYGHALIKRFTYGSVVDEIDAKHLSGVPVPIVRNDSILKKINDLALEANKLRTQAYYKEQEAVRRIDEDIIGA